MLMNLSKRSAVALIISFCGMLVASCYSGTKTEYNYKITINVEANGKTYSGSTVQKLTTINGPSSSLGTGSSATRKGEAVVVNVDGKYLFLLFNYSVNRNSNYQDGWKPWKLADIWEHGTDVDKGYAEYRYPFVTFTDISDPLTVKQVTEENFGQYFMGGKITSIEVQKTNEPVTYGQVEKVIPWMKDLKTTLDGKYSTSSMELSNNLDRSFFILD